MEAPLYRNNSDPHATGPGPVWSKAHGSGPDHQTVHSNRHLQQRNDPWRGSSLHRGHFTPRHPETTHSQPELVHFFLLKFSFWLRFFEMRVFFVPRRVFLPHFTFLFVFSLQIFYKINTTPHNTTNTDIKVGKIGCGTKKHDLCGIRTRDLRMKNEVLNHYTTLLTQNQAPKNDYYGCFSEFRSKPYKVFRRSNHSTFLIVSPSSAYFW